MTLQELTHDDYKRLLVSLEVPAHGFGTFEERKDRRSRWFQFAHEAQFGCKPIDCAECKDEAATMRALDCNEHGEPVDS